MKWKEYKFFKEENINNNAFCLVYCHSKDGSMSGIERAEIIMGRLCVSSEVMNYYEEDYYITHFIIITTPTK